MKMKMKMKMKREKKKTVVRGMGMGMGMGDPMKTTRWIRPQPLSLRLGRKTTTTK